MDAITKGTMQGLTLLLNVTAMLIVLVALVYLANAILGGMTGLIGLEPLTLQQVLGWVMAPICWLMGIPWSEAATAGSLMGIKTVLNEFLAYIALTQLPAEALSARSELIMTYALCGFANLGSLGIMIGGLATLAPERRAEIVNLGGKSLVAGTLATCMTGAVVGVLG
jgi:CNT family concentrative nucleoside transporter